MGIEFAFKKETKTCYCFQSGERPDMMTLYLKKACVDEAGINPRKGIIITVEEDKTND